MSVYPMALKKGVLREGWWLTAGGKSVPIRLMDNQHLANAITWLERYARPNNAAWQNKYNELLEETFKRRKYAP